MAKGTAGELGTTSSTTVAFALVDFRAVFRARGLGESLAVAECNARLGVALPSGLCDGVRFFEAAFADDLFGVAEAVTGDTRRAVSDGGVDVLRGDGCAVSPCVWLQLGIA